MIIISRLISNLEIFMGEKKYKFSKGFYKAIISIVLFAIPVIINTFPDWANLTLGGALTLIFNFLKVKYIS